MSNASDSNGSELFFIAIVTPKSQSIVRRAAKIRKLSEISVYNSPPLGRETFAVNLPFIPVIADDRQTRPQLAMTCFALSPNVNQSATVADDAHYQRSSSSSLSGFENFRQTVTNSPVELGFDFLVRLFQLRVGF